MVTVPCGRCRYPIKLDVELWHMRRVNGNIVQVCDRCSKSIDTVQTGQALNEARACVSVERAVRNRQAVALRPEGYYRVLAGQRRAA